MVSYKIGELKIRTIRQKAEKALGNRFDIQAFHDQLLKDGPMRLMIFETKMDSWINSQQAIAKKN